MRPGHSMLALALLLGQAAMLPPGAKAKGEREGLLQAAAAGEESSLSLLGAQERKIRLLESKLANARRPPRPFLWQTYGPRDGLPSTEVYRILQTPDHVLWVGGIRGLHRFDGMRWSSVPGAVSRCHGLLYEEATGALWAGFEGGVYRLAKGGTALEPVRFEVEPRPFRTPALGLDQLGRLWATSAEGLFLRGEDGRFRLQPTPAIESLAYATPVFAGAPGELLLGTETGLYAWRDGDGKWARAPGSPRSRVLALESDGANTLFVGTAEGLFVRSPAGRWRVWTEEDGLPVEYISALDHDGQRLWIGTWNGLCSLEGDRLSCFEQKDGLGANQVREVYVDRRGLVWAGTRGGGVSVLNRGLWSHFGEDLGLPPGQVVYSHHVDSDGTIWFEAGKHGLLRVRKDGSHELLGVPGIVRSVARDASGKLWAGRQDSNPAWLEAGRWHQLSGRELRGAYFLCPGAGPDEMWIGTYLNGLFRRRMGALTHWGPNQLGHGFVRLLHRGKDGTIYVGTLNGDLWKLAPGTDDLERWDPAPGRLPSTRVQAMAETADGALWLGTNLGAVRLRGGKAAVFTVEQGLGDNDVRAITEEAPDRLWFGTAKGLSLFDGDVWVTLGPSDGVPGELVTGLALVSGGLWITGSSGISLLHLASVPAPETFLELSPADLEEGSGRQPAGGRLVIASRHVRPLVRAQTGWWDFPSRLFRYSYRLDGGHWSAWIRGGGIDLRDLATGPHRLEVRARGPFFQTAARPAILSFEVRPPLSQSLLAAAAAGLLGAAAAGRWLWRKRGRYVGPYRLIRALGRGGAGHVWKARDMTRGGVVALKVLHPALASSEEVLERFRREGEAAARVEHQNLARILDRGEHGGKAYLAMELLDARTLREELRRAGGRMPLTDVLDLAEVLLDTLEAMHAQKVLHLDLKPDNVLVLRHGGSWQERLRLTDFGLAELMSPVEGKAQPARGGSLRYMAPEQALGKPLDARADLFSIAAILYELVSGGPPFRGTHDLAVLQSMMSGQLPVLDRPGRAGLGELEAVLHKGLAADARDRFNSASELRAALAGVRAAISGVALAAPPQHIARSSAEPGAASAADPYDRWTTSLLSSSAPELRRRLRLLYDLIEALLHPDLEELLERLLDRVIGLLGAEHGFIYLREFDGSIQLRVARGTAGKESRALCERVMESGLPAYLLDEQRSTACVPFLEGGTASGALYLESSNVSGSHFSLEDGHLLASLAALAATAIANAGELRRRHAAEEAARDLEEQVQQAQKMETVGTLAGGIAHDFNNLLGGMIGTLSMIDFRLGMAPGLSREELGSELDVVRDCALRAAEIVQQLLSLSRRTELRLGTVDLGLLVGDVGKMCRASFDHTIDIRIVVPEQSLRVEADPVRIKQVLLNLAINARDAMPQGGRLSFEMRRSSAEDGRPMVRVSLHDSGIGIEPTDLPRIFDPFFTTKPIGKGTGLGLAMVYGIVTQHRGSVHVESLPGQGSTFHVDLPASEKEPHSSSIPLSELPGGSETILVVDDEMVVRQMARGMLQTLGYRVLCAEDGEEALEILESGEEKVDLVVLDLIMPRLSGRDTLLRLRALEPSLPVLVSSGVLLDAQALGTRGLKISGLLAKPYELTDLAIAVRLALESRPRPT